MTIKTGALGSRSWRPGRDLRAVLHTAAGGAPRAGTPTPRVLVIGGGVAGITAAVALAERGVHVLLAEQHHELGGRVRSWTVQHGPDAVTMSRGFHAFFRQYYNLRAVLRRVDPELERLTPLADYPVRMADGTTDSFAGIPRTPPLNLMMYALRNPLFGIRGLAGADLGAAMGIVDLKFPQSFADYDQMSAAEFLDSLRFPPLVRHLALEVFARSFFADPRDFSAGELLAMFHLYFVGSAEGLLFDVAEDDFGTAYWTPLQRYLGRLGAEVRLGGSVADLSFGAAGGVRAFIGGQAVDADAVVIATDLRTTRKLVSAAIGLPKDSWQQRLAGTSNSPRFVVWRLWLDRPVSAERPAFLGTGGFELLDNISVLERYEAGASRWAAERGGSVVELHAYDLHDNVSDGDLKSRLRRELTTLYPETANADIVADEWLMSDDCPSWRPGEWSTRPEVGTPDPRIVLAGDGVRCDLPVALMERAATTGFQAANTLLHRWNIRGHDLWTVPMQSRVPGVSAIRRLIS